MITAALERWGGWSAARLVNDIQLLDQVAGERVDVRDEFAARDQAEVQLVKVAEQGNVQALAVGDHRHWVVGQQLRTAQVYRHVRARNVRDADIERREPVQQPGGEYDPGGARGQCRRSEAADLVHQALRDRRLLRLRDLRRGVHDL